MRVRQHCVILCAIVSVLACGSLRAEPMLPDFSAATFSNSLKIDNPYHPLAVGDVRTYAAEETDLESGEIETETIVIEVLNETRTVAGVESRVVRDRVLMEDGRPIEDTFDWFAQDDAGNVWYMGESVTDYHYDEDGNFTGISHPGEWEAGVDGASPGWIMPADVEQQLGLAYYQEFYVGFAEDEAEVIGVDETHTIPYGTFEDVIRTAETTVFDPDVIEHKFYAPGIGKIFTHKLDAESGVVYGGEQMVSFVPEPGSALLCVFGVLGLLMARRRGC